MFKQFVQNIEGPQVYLVSSLAIFLVFFIVISILLFYMSKQHISYMSDMPLHDTDSEPLTLPNHEE